MNSKLLRKVAKAIEKRPDRYNQGTWLSIADSEYVPRPTLQNIRKGKFECGAVGCVAGHAVILADVGLKQFEAEDGTVDIRKTAMELLDIDYDLAGWLFSGSRQHATMPKVLRAIADGETNRRDLEELEYDG